MICAGFDMVILLLSLNYKYLQGNEYTILTVLVAHSSLTLGDPMDCSPPGSSVHGILQARILE